MINNHVGLLDQRCTADPEVHHSINEHQGTRKQHGEESETTHLLESHHNGGEDKKRTEESGGEIDKAPGRGPGRRSHKIKVHLLLVVGIFLVEWPGLP